MLHFIVNKNSRSGKGVHIWEAVELYLKAQNIEYQMHATEYQGHATELAREICELPEEDKAEIIRCGILALAGEEFES